MAFRIVFIPFEQFILCLIFLFYYLKPNKWHAFMEQALMVICNWELAEARKRDALDRARVRGEEPPPEVLAEERGLHSSIEADVKNLLEGKKFRDLEAMQQQIESQMRSGTAKVVEYWEAILKRLQIYKAKVYSQFTETSLFCF